MRLDLPDAFLEAVAARIAERAAQLLADRLDDRGSPWLSRAEAVEYSRLGRSTFDRQVAEGRIRSHGARSHASDARAQLDSDFGGILRRNAQ